MGKTFDYYHKRYKEAIYPEVEKSTKDYKEQKAKFFDDLFIVAMDKITPSLLDEYIKQKKKFAIKNGDGRRYNFDNELDELRAVFNWVNDNYDDCTSNPLKRRHWALGKIKTLPERNKKLKQEEVKLFLASLQQHCLPIIYDFCVCQFYMASRVQEPAGLLKECVDLEERAILIKNVVVWFRETKKFDYLKPIPKNKSVRYCHIPDTLLVVLKRRINQSPSKYVFEIDGKPLEYSFILRQYNKALKKAGLGHKYSGTHIMKHSPASLTRKATGSLDSTQAMTGNKDIRVVQHYAGGPEDKQIDAVLQLEELMNGSDGKVKRRKLKAVR